MFARPVLALLAPGQGAQTPGMLAPWLATEGAEGRIQRWSELTGLDLLRLGTRAEAEEIKDTAVAQPLIVAVSLLAFQQLRQTTPLPADAAVAGHSVGELAAAAMAGVLSQDDAVALAAIRGREMAAACALEPTGMSAVMLGEETDVLARLDDLGLTPANRNGASQIVAAGPLDALEKLAVDPPAGAKVRPLAVAGAFHTRYMEPAKDALTAYAKNITVSDPDRLLLSNADGGVIRSGVEMLNRLVEQVTRPVRWDACVATLAELGTTTTIELPPGRALTGLVKRQIKPVTALPLQSPDEIDTLAELLAESAAGTAAKEEA